MTSIAILTSLVVCGFLVEDTKSHGMMVDPPNRSSLWRFNESFPINYNDNELFCGGFGVQWGLYGGKCGACGDNFGDSVPRQNENTGTYGLGYIVAQYPSGSDISVKIKLTANHLGSFWYSICRLIDSSKPEEDNCFEPLLLADGSESFNVASDVYDTINIIRLPNNFKCNHCVLRWHYRAGNSWGECKDGSEGIGCGPQETFRSCSDISIY